MEQWKYIKEYDNKYAVSSYGRVKSFKGITERILKPSKTHDGYEFVVMCKNNKTKPFRINRLVAIHFIQNPNNFPQVDHIDGNKVNNHVENLQWMSAKDNTTKSQGKAVNQLSLDGEFILAHVSISDAANFLQKDKANIHKALNKKYTTAYGFKWEYATTN